MKNRQGLTIAALIVAIVGLSIGFAAFSNTLTISSSASVNPSDQNFIVEFASQSSGDSGNSDVTIQPTQATSDYGTNATIPYSNKKSLTGVHATFTAPGQSVTYELYVRNAGQYVAYLKDLEFANATNATQGETYKHCYAKTTNVPAAQQATGSLVSAACEGIDISVTIGTASNITPASQSKSLGNQSLAANGGYVSASVTITYANNAAYVDGPMEVEFGDISFIASSNPAVQQQQQVSPSESSVQVPSVLGTYSYYMGSDTSTEVQLNEGGSATLSNSYASQIPATYTYDGVRTIATSSMAGDITFTFVDNGNNKILYCENLLNQGFAMLTTQGSTGLTPLSASYTGQSKSGDGTFTLTFSTNGKLSGYPEEDKDYIVLGNTIYFIENNAIDFNDYFTTSDNFATLDFYERGQYELTISRQS